MRLVRASRIYWIKYVVINLVIFLGVILILKNSSAEGRNETLSLGVQEYATPIEAIDFTLKDLDNKRISLRNYKGKIVMLNFWATWCAPCRLEMPSMEKLYRQFKDKGFVVLAVAAGEKADDVTAFVKEYHITFSTLLDTDQGVAEGYKVWALPTTYFINAEGKIIGRVNGSRDWSAKEATQYISSILQKTSLSQLKRH
ncbi:MAG: TlpA family protein disulfide reductase [Nitrospirae bacterium]|nr:TlpA family protein disulfide reductase [Nitrospirota bacterium]